MTRLILGLLGAVAFTLVGAGPGAEAQTAQARRAF